MKVALISAPFISVPPTNYGGNGAVRGASSGRSEQKSVEVVVYANGESTKGYGSCFVVHVG